MKLTLRFETAPNVPPPFAYQYELALAFDPQSLHANLRLTYLDREDLDPEEIENEGFTQNDDYDWQGQLEPAWQAQLEKIWKKTKLETEDNGSDNDDFLELEMQATTALTVGVPKNYEEWHYMAQELLQAVFETAGKERPFELKVLQNNESSSVEAILTASFKARSAQVKRIENGKSALRHYAWHTLSELMQTLYAPDYENENVPTKKPTQLGLFVNVGDQFWYEIGTHIVEPGKNTKALLKLENALGELLQ
jgi:hypothetical protein